MKIEPQLFTAKVMHERLLPRRNSFCYGVYYLALPLAEIDANADFPGVCRERFGLHSFYNKDHGARDGSKLQTWLEQILGKFNLGNLVADVMVLSFPRVLGYVFNPVSFWLCYDSNRELIAVLCEVNNTFGETHSYLCFNEDHTPLLADQWLSAEKVFHVSPFLPREGSYDFRFSVDERCVEIWINYINDDGQTQLITSLSGDMTSLTKASLLKAFICHPLVTLKAIYLIHWQALKLIAKGIGYVPKPKQHSERVSSVRLTKVNLPDSSP